MPPKFKDKDTQFLENLIPKLKRDILSQMVGVNFGSAREKQRFIKAVSDLMHEYSKEIGDKTEKELTEAWNFEKEAVELFTQNISFSRKPTRATLDFLLSLNDIIKGTKTELDNLFDTSTTSFVRSLNFAEGRIRNEILAEISSGSLSGKPFSEISRRLTELFEKEGIPGFTITDKNGNNINYTLESRANRIVSHAIITSRQKAVVMEAVRNGIDLIKISKHGDESPMCKPHSGKVYSITGLTEGYPLLETALWNGGYKKGDGVGHPYCRHTFMAHIPTNIEFVVEYTKYGSQRGKMQSSEMTQKEKREIQRTIEKRQKEIEELKQKRAEQSKNFTKADWDKYGKSLSGDISSIEII